MSIQKSNQERAELTGRIRRGTAVKVELSQGRNSPSQGEGGKKKKEKEKGGTTKSGDAFMHVHISHKYTLYTTSRDTIHFRNIQGAFSFWEKCAVLSPHLQSE